MATNAQPRSHFVSVKSTQLKSSPCGFVDDHGVTLMELLVVMVVTSIIGGLILATLIILGNITTRTTERTEEFVDVQQAMEEIATNLRGATATHDGDSKGRLYAAEGRRIFFYTASGEGLNKPAQLMGYTVLDGNLIHYLPGPAHDGRDWANPKSQRVLLRGVVSGAPFEYYTWSDPNATGGKCYRKLTSAELTHTGVDSEGNPIPQGIHARNAIAGVKINLRVKEQTNVRFKGEQAHSTWIRLGESIEPKDPITGALIPGWPKNCWVDFGEQD